MYAAIVMPYRIAFVSEESEGYLVIDYIIDGLFMLDVVINLLSAYYDENEELIVSKRVGRKYFLSIKYIWQINLYLKKRKFS
jgi:hypothetical protein